MKIVRENRENQTALIKVTVEQADYAADVEKKLRDYKRKAQMPGFRPGMVPMTLINKMYRKGVVAETAYKMASDGCFDYIEKENIDYMGDVLPSDEQGAFDFDNNTDHDFIFEVGLAPEVKIEFDPKEKITRYNIKPADEMREGFRTNYLNRYGKLVDVEVVTSDEALSVELNNGEIEVKDAYVGLISMNDEARKPFIGKKVGDQMIVNVNELYPTEQQRGAVLGVKGEALANINPEFNLVITQIRKFAAPELTEEFFKEAFPGGEVKSTDEFEKFIDAQIAKEMKQESDYIFGSQLRDFVIEKANITLPEDFLKRWLLVINEGKYTMEDIEKDFEGFVQMMKWSTIQKHYVKELGITVTEEDMNAEAKALAAAQFAQYGMLNIGEEMLDNYAKQILSNKQEANKVLDKLYERKVLDAIEPMVGVSKKSVSSDDLAKVLEKDAAKKAPKAEKKTTKKSTKKAE
ncbi:MAG: trigger factor [Tidjanibacter sp.]|nr:trigger factor [Tidjanibacter sp.]MBR7102334.1 trigger factor [Tidjanibacter sp.]